MKIVFMGTPEFSVPALRAVAAVHDVVAVYTQPDREVGRGLELRPSPVKLLALELGVPVEQAQRLSASGELEKLAAYAPDAIVVVAFGQILKKEVLALPRLGCINIHSSLLPRWRGAAPIQHAILAGDRVSGVTTMFMAEKLDAGDILLQEETPLSERETALSLHDRLAEMGARLIVQTLAGLEGGTLSPTPQDEGRVTYASKLTKEMEWLDSSGLAKEADRRVRALNPWPGTSVRLETGERLKIRRAVPRLDLSGFEGRLVERNGMLLLGFREGSLEVQRVQPDGKKEMDAQGFINGLRGRALPLPLAWSQ